MYSVGNVKLGSYLYLAQRTMTLRRTSHGLKLLQNQNFIKGQRKLPINMEPKLTEVGCGNKFKKERFLWKLKLVLRNSWRW